MGVGAIGLGTGLGVSGTFVGIASNVGSGVAVTVAAGSDVTFSVGSGVDVKVGVGSDVTSDSGVGLGDRGKAFDSSVWHARPPPSIASKAIRGTVALSNLMRAEVAPFQSRP